jgi:O-antigen ligase
MLPSFIGVNLRLAMVMMSFCLLAALFTGGILESAKTPIVVMFTVLTLWLMLCTLTSQWRGGSLKAFTVWLMSYACVLVVPPLISNIDQCRKVYYALAFSLIPILFATVIFQAQLQGRDGTAFGTLGNPNDLAFSILVLIPFAVFVISSESALNWKTIVCVLAIGFAMIKTMRTGSRAALLGIATATVIVFFVGKMKTRLVMLVGTALICVIALAATPDNIMRRYATMFNGTSYEADMDADERSAVESSRARKMLFEESVRVMLEYPVFGVGPGIFSAALAKEQEKRGEFQTWHEAHNTFTQLGSEAGIPAILLYLAIVIYCLKRTVSIFRSARHDPNQIVICRMAASLAMALVIFVICAAFGTYSYTVQLPVLAGLVQAFDMSVRKAKKTVPAIVAAALPIPSAAPAVKPPTPSYVRNSLLQKRRSGARV